MANNSKDLLWLCQRIAGIYAAGKNMHYLATTYGDHLLADRFVVGGDDGFNCFDAIDEIQESLVMYGGPALDENEIFLYPENYSLAVSDFKDYYDGVAKLADLFSEFIEAIDEMDLDDAEGDLLPNLARKAQRAAAFLRMAANKEKENGRKSSSMAEDGSAAEYGKVA